MQSKTLAASVFSTPGLHDTIKDMSVTARNPHHHYISDQRCLSDLSTGTAMSA